MTRARRRRALPAPARAYPPGYFLELVRKHDWPPGFVPAADAPGKAGRPVASLTERERQAVLGIGWGTGTTPMARTPGNLRPAWMLRPP